MIFREENAKVRKDASDVEWVDLQGRADADVIDTSPPPRRRLPKWTLLLLAIPVALIATLVAVGTQSGRHNHGLSPTASLSVRGMNPANENPPSYVPSPIASTTPSPPPRQRQVVMTDFGHPLLGITGSYELFVLATDGMVRIDFAHGRVTRTALDPLDSNGGVAFLATANAALIHPQDNVTGYLVPDGKDPRTLSNPLARPGPTFPGPKPGLVWVSTSNSRMSLVDENGRPAGGSVTIPGGQSTGVWALAPDGSGNLLFTGIGGVYALRAGAAQRITTGTLLAVGPTRWLADECDERYRCTMVAIDKQTLAKHVVGPGSAVYSVTGLISPDGSTAAMLEPTGDEFPVARLVLLDINTGQVRRIALKISTENMYQSGGALVWTPDGRWMFGINDAGQLVRVDPRSGHVEKVDLPLPELLSQVAIRP